MSTTARHSTFIRTPKQLIVAVLLAFVVPIVSIVLLVQLVLNRPSADPGALTPQAIAERIQPVGRVQFGAAGAAAGAAARSGEQVVQRACGACHVAGVANAPKIGDQAAWAKVAKSGLPALVKTVIAGKGAMPPRGGFADLSNDEIADAIAYMAGQSGATLKK